VETVASICQPWRTPKNRISLALMPFWQRHAL